MTPTSAPPIALIRSEVDGSAWAYLADARELLLHLAQGRTPSVDDLLPQSIQLRSGETACGVVGLCLRTLTGSRWSAPTPVQVIVTDHRLIVALATGETIHLEWSQLAAFEPDLTRAHLVVGPGAGPRFGFSGSAVPILAVVGVSVLYGADALVTHPALRPLRRIC